VKIAFTFGSGARAGQTEEFSQSFVQIGRHPHCDLRFDADRDLDVSSRHATVVLQEGMFILRDLGSTNGTFVNGKRLTADHVIAHDDEIQFGRQGPKVKIALIREPRTAPGQAVAASGPPSPPGAPAPRIERSVRRTPPGPTTTRIKVEVARQTASLRRTTIILLGLLMLLAGAYLWQSLSASRKIEQERTELLQMADSLAAAYASVQANVASLQGALDSAEAETARLRARIGQGGDASALAEIRAQLQTAQRRQQSISAAASIEPTAINRANKDAVAVILVEFTDGSVRTGSGFAVRSDANSVLLLTNRHVVTGTTGASARRMGAIFNGSNQNFPAELVTTHGNSGVDLALVRVPLRGGIETVVSIAASVAPEEGEPVAIIGYPLGLDMAMGGEWQQVGVSTSFNAGTLSKVLDNQLAITGYGAAGMSGSPVFNRQGQVIGIVYGGQRDSQGRVVLAVPVRFARELLAAQ
jgi:S1-C subfamily serine protease